MHCRCIATHILSNGVNLVSGHVELVATLVCKQQVIALCTTYCTTYQTFKFANAMVVMNDVIARFEILERGTRCARACSAWSTTPAGEVGLGNESNMCTWHVSAEVHSCCCDINCRWQFWLFQRADRVEPNNIGATLLQTFREAFT